MREKDSGNLKIVFVLLIEIIVLLVQISIVEIETLKFEKLVEFIPSFATWSIISDLSDTSSHKLLQKVIIWRGYRNEDRCRTWSGGLRPEMGGQIAGFSQYTGRIVEKWGQSEKWRKGSGFSNLLNELAEL